MFTMHYTKHTSGFRCFSESFFWTTRSWCWLPISDINNTNSKPLRNQFCESAATANFNIIRVGSDSNDIKWLRKLVGHTLPRLRSRHKKIRINRLESNTIHLLNTTGNVDHPVFSIIRTASQQSVNSSQIFNTVTTCD